MKKLINRIKHFIDFIIYSIILGFIFIVATIVSILCIALPFVILGGGIAIVVWIVKLVI